MATSLFSDSSQGRYFDKFSNRQSAMTWDTVFAMDHLNEDTCRHLKRVYLLLAFTVIGASLGSWGASYYVGAASSAMLAIFLLSIVIILVIGFTPSTQETAKWRAPLLVFFGFLQGIAVSPLIASVAQVDPSIPLKAFLLTCVVFVCFSLAALLCTDRRFLYLYGICSTALLGLCVLSILNIFIASPFIQNVWLYGGLILFSVFVAVDTQVIIERSLRGDSDSVSSALDLFLDALNIFIRIMIILSRNKKNSSGGSVV